MPPIGKLKIDAPALIALIGIGVIGLAILFGPLASPPEFSWWRHSISEQSGQNLKGAWIMRLGLFAYGLAVLSSASIDWRRRTLVRAALILFGLGLVGTAVWSNASILPDTVSDMTEDRLHSIASGVVGTAFAIACAARLFGPAGTRHDILAWIAMSASVILPLLMLELPDFRGLTQRIMFAISFLFVAREFVVSNRGQRNF